MATWWAKEKFRKKSELWDKNSVLRGKVRTMRLIKLIILRKNFEKKDVNKSELRDINMKMRKKVNCEIKIKTF